MAALDFPSSPTTGQTYTANSTTWTWDGSTWISTNAAAREVLTANRTYYVRTDGSDSNNGLANTAGGAFLTIQKAVNVIYGLDISTYTVTIKLGNSGTWTAGITLDGPWVGNGTVLLQGDTTTPANTIISVTSGNCISLSNNARISLQAFKLSTTTSGACISCQNSAVKVLGSLDFGACAQYHMLCGVGGKIYADYGTGAYTISGGGWVHWFATQGSHISFRATTITLTGTPVFSSSTVISDNCANIFCDTVTFSGAATGLRYQASLNGVINTGGGGATYIPGSGAGTTATGGQYA